MNHTVYYTYFMLFLLFLWLIYLIWRAVVIVREKGLMGLWWAFFYCVLGWVVNIIFLVLYLCLVVVVLALFFVLVVVLWDISVMLAGEEDAMICFLLLCALLYLLYII